MSIKEENGSAHIAEEPSRDHCKAYQQITAVESFEKKDSIHWQQNDKRLVLFTVVSDSSAENADWRRMSNLQGNIIKEKLSKG